MSWFWVRIYALLYIEAVMCPRNENVKYEGWNLNSGNYLFTTDTK